MSTNGHTTANMHEVESAPTMKIGFSFAAAPSQKRKVLVIPTDSQESREYINNVADGTIEPVGGIRVTGPIVIPLETQAHNKKPKIPKPEDIKKESIIIPAPVSTVSPVSMDPDAPKKVLTLDEIAAAELITDASSEKTSTSTLVLPLLMQNRIEGIENFTDDDERFKYDLSLRPDEATLEDYEKIPIEDYGSAMLRGMGWDPDSRPGLGPKGESRAEPTEYVRRPGFRLGLGATPKQQEEKKAKKRILKPGESSEPAPVMVAPAGPDGKVRHVKSINEALVPLRVGLYPGLRVRIISGPHASLRGRVVKVDKGDVMVRLRNDEELWVGKDDVVDAGQEDRPQDSHKARSKDKSSAHDSRHKSSVPDASSRKSWLRPNIVVKIVSKTWLDGKYYNKKGRVVDVSSGGVCDVQLLDDNRLVQNVRQDVLETAIPRSRGERVVVVSGPERGRHGIMVERKSETAVLQMAHDLDLMTFKLDDIAQYAGPDEDVDM
eukprot:TRINITY_DN8292_c0_g1_i1.p1 TRINITY_DN8292_c0_g1~~TRINITY_DN8292_c0_g1_i1.p1  ORF type:complete len:492 (+),score=107.03 TRINITY_DN8292_c0_g1_i1:67-1542(+)